MTTHTQGMLLITVSAFFYASYGIWSRLMVSSFGEFSQAWTRGLLLLIVIILANQKYRFLKPIHRKDFIWFAIIALAGGLNQAPYFFGFEHLSIGTATMLFYASLVIGGYLIGKFVIHEQLDLVKYLSLGVGIVGIVTIYNFSLTPQQMVPALLTILAGLMGSCTVALTKKVSGNYHELQIMTGYFLVSVIANGILSLILQNDLPTANQPIPWLAQLGYAVSMLIANFTAIEGFKHLDASIASLIGLSEILFGIIFGILLFGESMSLSIAIGAILIVVSAALPNVTKNPKDRIALTQ